MTAPAAVSVRDLARRFGETRAVAGIAFDVAPGEIFGLVGPDGAGKTTTMRMLAGVMRPDQGQVAIDGVDVVAHPEQARQRVSYMPQRFALYEDLTVDENIRFFADLFEVPRQQWRERAARLLEASGMLPFRRRLAGQLSGGMKQKLGLTCALVHAPRVLLLDEPTTGVDPLSNADTPARLKALLPGAILRVGSDRPRVLAQRALACAGVLGALPAGDGVNLHVDDAALRRGELAAALADLGIRPDDLVPVEPSVEDLFVALLERRPQGAVQ
jgi:ABC-2 type transport system ATP-binding protein